MCEVTHSRDIFHKKLTENFHDPYKTKFMLNTKTFCVKIRFFLSICRASSKCLLNSRELHTQVGNNFHILLQQHTDTLHKICSIKKKPLFDLHLLAHTQTICDDIRRDAHSGNNHK